MSAASASTSTTREITPHVRYLLEEYLWLVGGGVNQEEAAERVGLSLATVQRYLYFAADEHIDPFDTYLDNVG
jgi:hypothetical protein